MDEIRLESYTQALMEFPDDANTFAVLHRLGNTRREQYEAAIIPKADLIHLVKQEGWDQRRKIREAAEAKRAADEAQHLRDHPEEFIVTPEEKKRMDALQAKLMQRTAMP